MYADMGHFGRLPIRLGWFAVVLPALTLSYLGQGALLLADPHAIENPFYLLAPKWAHYPLVLFATLATIIASQAIISGAELAHAADDPARLPAPHARASYCQSRTRSDLHPACELAARGRSLGAVITFGSSDVLGGAYGIAVSMLTAITTVLAGFVALKSGSQPARHHGGEWAFPASLT